jgi:ABC-type nitrate/sulfonate/bicarbonate transport system substrate-binding protein
MTPDGISVKDKEAMDHTDTREKDTDSLPRSNLKINRRHFLGHAAIGTLSLVPLGIKMGFAQAAVERLTLAVGTAPPDPACHYFYYAREKQFYAKNGIEVDIKGMISATNATRAVVSGDADIGWVDGVSSLVARDQGAKIKVLSAFAPKLDYLIVGSKEIRTMKELEGKRFAVATIGGGTFIIPKVMCEKVKADTTKIQFVTLGNSAARAQALVAKTVDATIVTSGVIPRLLSYDYLHVIANAGAELPDFIYTWELVSETNLQTKRAALEAFVIANAQAVNWAYSNPDEAARISIELLPDANKDEIRNAILSYVKQRYWSTDGSLARKVLDYSTAQLSEANLLKGTVKYEDFYAQDIASAVRARL